MSSALPEPVNAEATGRSRPAVAAKASGFSAVLERLGPHMASLDRFLRAQLDAFEPEIRSMVDYCVDTSGKRIRPTLVFLSGWRGDADGGRNRPIAPELVRVAAVVELVHLATLVHDDIMDEADVRRSRRTAAREFGPTAAVLLGDALFSHALHLATQFPTTEVCAAVSESTRRVCAGEIMQTLRRGTTNVTRADYQRIVDLKTAELFRVSCFLGAKLAGYGSGFVEAASRFGRHLGIAYQIYDDLVDFFGEEAQIGKTLGTDLASGKLTLPLLALLERLPRGEAAALSAEIIGERPPQPALRLAQMREFDVFEAVRHSVRVELDAAAAALDQFSDCAPTPLLMALVEALGAQVGALARSG